MVCLEILREPSEGFAVALSSQYTAHKEFHGTAGDVRASNVALASGRCCNAEQVAKFLFTHRSRQIDLVAEYDHGSVGNLLVGQQALEKSRRVRCETERRTGCTHVEFCFGLRETAAIDGIDEKDDGINCRKVIFPYATS